MTVRITERDLLREVNRLNSLTDSPMNSYTETDCKLVANVGNYHLSYAYGGVTLHRMTSDGGSVTLPISCGYTSKTKLYSLIQAYISGLQEKSC